MNKLRLGLLLLLAGCTPVVSEPKPVSPTVSPSPVVVASPSPSPTPQITPTPVVSPTPQVTPTPVVSLSPSPLPQPVEPPQQMSEQAKAILASRMSVDSLVEMQVAIARNVPTLTFSTPGSAIAFDSEGKVLQELTPNQTYTIQADGNQITINSQTFPQLVFLDIPKDSRFQLGDRTYRGTLLLAAQNHQLLAVNYINLKQYLHSVVAAEVSPSWPKHALKAQAIAARSYALTYYFKPVSSLYHLGSDEYYQVYQGLEKEDSRTNQAVDETSGEFVSYRGGIVESLYAASDEIVAEAFQGKGMSQLGALGLAEQGYTYPQILANYYPKTAVSRIKHDME